MRPATATIHEAQVLDLTEAVMLADWRATLLMEPRPIHDGAYAQRAEFVVGLIAAAVTFDPRHGMDMDPCEGPGCDLLVDADRRRQDGRLYCSWACDDAASELSDMRRHHALLVDGRYDVRPKVWAS